MFKNPSHRNASAVREVELGSGSEGILEETLEQGFLCAEQPVPSADPWAWLGGGLAQGCGHSGATSGFD